MPTITIALPAYVTELQAEPFPASATTEVAQTVSLTAGAGSIVVAATGGAWCWRFTECGPGYRKARFAAVAGDIAYGSLVDLDPGTLVATVEPADPAWEATAQAAVTAASNAVTSVGRIRMDAAGFPSLTAALAAATAGAYIHVAAGTYLSPAGLGAGPTVPADDVTIEFAPGAEVRVQTWGQPGIDGFGRSGLTVLGGVVRYVGTRGNHTGAYRGGALYCNGAGVYINKDRCTVDGLRTINMPQGVFLSSYNGASWTDRIGLNNRVSNVETEGMNFGVLYVGQQALTLDNLYAHDDIDDSSGANPTHAFYGSSTSTFRSRGGAITNCIAERILYGQPYQAKHHDELVVSDMIARDSRGLMNLIGCADGTLSSMVATGYLPSLAAPNGALTVQDESSKSARMTFRDVSIVADQSAGVDQRAVIFVGSDFTIENLIVTGKRTTTGSAGAGVVQVVGNRHTLRNPRISDTSGLNPVAIILGDGTNATQGTLVDDPRISGCLRAVDTFGTSDGVIRYQNDMVSVSQAFTTTATAYTIVRDGLRIRSSTPEGAVTAPPGTTLARTDTGVLMIKGSGTGNTGWVNV